MRGSSFLAKGSMLRMRCAFSENIESAPRRNTSLHSCAFRREAGGVVSEEPAVPAGKRKVKEGGVRCFWMELRRKT